MSSIDLTCNESYDPYFGQVRFEDDAAVNSTASDNNNDESNMTADSTSVMATPSSSEPPPPYQPMGAYRCHHCGALNNIAAASLISPPPPYEAQPQPQVEEDAVPVVAVVPEPTVIPEPATPEPAADPEPVAEPPVGPAGADVAEADLFAGPEQVINFVGMQPDGQNYTSVQPPIDDDYGHREQVPFRDLLGPADDDDSN